MISENQRYQEWLATEIALSEPSARSAPVERALRLLRLRPRMEDWRRRQRGWLVVAVLFVVLLAGALTARRGGGNVASGGATILLGVLFAAAIVVRMGGRTLRPILTHLRRHAPEITSSLERALALVARSKQADDGTSADLPLLHLRRTLELFHFDTIARELDARGRRVEVACAMFAVAGGVSLVALSGAVFEGLDVLLANRHVAPLPFPWLDDVTVRVHPPPYLHIDDWVVSLPGNVVVPAGSTLLVRGAPRRQTALLAVFGDRGAESFEDDGRGLRVAEWKSFASEDLTIAAVFGDVLIPMHGKLRVRVLPDAAPHVGLQGAPREVRADSDEVSQTGGIAIAYDATDDHGLAAVDLVLHSGSRDERRSLARLDGTTRSYSGALTLRLRDPFLKGSVAPVLVYVEARDNDGANGAKWGRSEAITFLPREIGNAEALRIDALRALRDVLVDSLSSRLVPATDVRGRGDAGADGGARESAENDRRLHVANVNALDAALHGRYDGLSVPSKVQRKLEDLSAREAKAIADEEAAPGEKSRSKVISANERWIMTLDRLVQSMGAADTKKVAKRLADVADELAQALDDQAAGRSSAEAVERATESETLLTSAGGSMLDLGVLGHDLGEIVDAYLARVARAVGANDLPAAQLAATYIALRLHTPDPSFGSKGGGRRRKGQTGGESGNQGDSDGSGGDESGDGDGADGEGEPGQNGGDGLASEIERLSAEHSGQMGELEEKARETREKLAEKGAKEAFSKHAAAVRDIARALPSQGDGSDTWTSKGAAAEEASEQMARALENGRLEEAVSSGRTALGALDEAAQIASSTRHPRGTHAQDIIEQATRGLGQEVAWAEGALRAQEARAADALHSVMEAQASAEQKTARRAEQLASGTEGRTGKPSGERGATPDAVRDALAEARRAADAAAQQLRASDLAHGQESQREVQRALERARQQLDDENREEQASRGDSDSGSGERGAASQNVAVPGADAHKGPDDLRRRVLGGLSKGAQGRLQDAVRRYADGLLK